MAAIKQSLKVDAQMEVGSSGQYEVFVDGQSVIAKDRSGFPTDEQVVQAVAKAIGGS